MASTKRHRSRRLFLIVGAVCALGISIGLLLELGPAPHHVTRYQAEKIAVTHLLPPGRQVHLQSKLIREWQLTFVSPNDGGNVWSNDLMWVVLVPDSNFAHSGPCCGASPPTSWAVAIVRDHSFSAQLDGIIAGVSGDAPAWWGLLPDLSGGR